MKTFLRPHFAMLTLAAAPTPPHEPASAPCPPNGAGFTNFYHDALLSEQKRFYRFITP